MASIPEKSSKVSGIPNSVFIVNDIKKLAEKCGAKYGLNDNEIEFLLKFLEWWQVRAEKYYSDVGHKFMQCWVTWKKEKESSIRAQALQILRNTQPLQRSPEQIFHLKEMCEYFGFAQGIPEKEFNRFCQNLEFRDYQNDEIIFLQGDKSQHRSASKYFMQLDGKVEFFAVADAELDTMREECSATKRRRMSSSELRRKLGTSLFLRHVGSFGEMLLITGQPRTASAIVTDWAQIMTCTADIFKECLLVHQREMMQLNAKVNFLQSMRMLKTWTKAKIMRLAYDLKLGEFGPCDVVFRQGDKVNKVALVCEGEAVLQKELIHVDSPAAPCSYLLDNPFKIANVRTGTMIGDIEVLNRVTNYLYTARVPTTGSLSVYLMSVSKFRTHFMYEDTSTRDFIQEIADFHREFYEKKLAEMEHSGAVESLKLPQVKKPDTFEKLFEKTGHDLNTMPTRRRTKAILQGTAVGAGLVLTKRRISSLEPLPTRAMDRSTQSVPTPQRPLFPLSYCEGMSASDMHRRSRNRAGSCESCPPVVGRAAEPWQKVNPQEHIFPRKSPHSPRSRVQIITLPTLKVAASEVKMDRRRSSNISVTKSNTQDLHLIQKMTDDLLLFNQHSEPRNRIKSEEVPRSKFMFASNSKVPKLTERGKKYPSAFSSRAPNNGRAHILRGKREGSQMHLGMVPVHNAVATIDSFPRNKHKKLPLQTKNKMPGF